MDMLDLILPIIALAAAVLVPLIRRLTSKQTGAALIDAINRGDAERVKKIIARGALVDATDDLIGRTPLISATMGGHTEIVKLLLARGADVNMADMEGWTALRYARGFGYEEIEELLVKSGARQQPVNPLVAFIKTRRSSSG